MQKFYTVFVLLFVVGSARAQDPIVNIPDLAFKNFLLNSSMPVGINYSEITIDANGDGELQQSEVLNVYHLDYDLSPLYIAEYTGIEYFYNLKTFNATSGLIQDINLNSLVNLEIFTCNYCNIQSLDLTGLSNLKELHMYLSDITNLEILNLNNLEVIDITTSALTNVNLQNLNNLESLDIGNNQQLVTLNHSGLNSLKYLDCHNALLNSLDVNGLISLEHLDVSHNYLTNFNFNALTTLKYLDCSSNLLTSINVNGLANLEELLCQTNQLSTLNLNGLVGLKNLQCSNNQLTTLNLDELINLEFLGCSFNQLTALNVNELENLMHIQCKENALTSLDLNNLHNLNYLNCNENNVSSLFIKNGIAVGDTHFQNNPNLQYICTDDNNITSFQTKANQYGYSNCVVNSYCSFTPGGQFYTINGTNKLDSDSDNCDASDPIFPHLKISISNGPVTGASISGSSGDYSIPVQSGTHTLTPIIENPSFFNVSPSSVSVTFPATTSPFTQNFCITPNGLHPDLEVVIIPTTPARPGFDADYTIVIKNKGNIQQSGSVTLTYDDTVLDYVIANPVFTTQATGSFTWDFLTLEPFETREIQLTLNVNSPMEIPAVNGDDVLNYTANITSAAVDETPLDNSFSLPQLVVNSFDPNDKTCLEGNTITPDMVGNYVHYMIRFENTGTFPAENIVVKDMIDLAKFDIATLVPLNSSHDFVTRITGNKVEFIFENIQLPFDDATNDGYVVFKIKTKPTLALDDTFSNTASIYVDYNFPIVTNDAVTTVALLNRQDFVFNQHFTLFPNPATDVLNISSKSDTEIQSINIYNILGQLVVAIPNADGRNSIDVANLAAGNYIINIITDMGVANEKFIKS